MFKSKNKTVDLSKIQINLGIIKFNVDARKPLGWIIGKGSPIISKIKNNGFSKIKIFIVILLIIAILLISLIIYNKKQEPKIYGLTEGYKLEYKQSFDLDSVGESGKWIYEDGENEFTTNDLGAKTLNTNAKIQRTYAMFQDLRNLTGDQLMVGKFNLKEGGKIGIRFVNTLSQHSDTIRPNHSNECVLQAYETEKISMGFGHQVTKNNFLGNESTFENKKISEGIYYILAQIGKGKFSCYYQKEGTEEVYQIIQDKNIIFENLGGPLLAKYIDVKSSYPELLEFILYTK